MAKKTTKTPKKVDLDELAAKSKTSINATDYQVYLRNIFKGIKY